MAREVKVSRYEQSIVYTPTIFIVMESWHGNSWTPIASYRFFRDAYAKCQKLYENNSPNKEWMIEEVPYDNGYHFNKEESNGTQTR